MNDEVRKRVGEFEVTEPRHEVEGEVTAHFVPLEDFSKYKTPVSVTYQANKIMGIELQYVYVVILHDGGRDAEPFIFFTKSVALEWARAKAKEIGRPSFYRERIFENPKDNILAIFNYRNAGDYLIVWEKGVTEDKEDTDVKG